jgi:predicted alpha/beta-fold hydrolase
MTFAPPRWLRSPHLQTMIPAMPVYAAPRAYGISDEEELRIPIENGSLHARAWWANAARAPAVIILHGIAGSKDSLCCVRVAVALHRQGYHAVRLDMRAAGDSVVDAPSLYHGGLTTDLDRTVRHLLANPRVSKVLILGYSGGGSIALKLAGEWGKAAPEGVAAIASVSGPLDYVYVARRMDMRRTLPYRHHVLGGLLERARAFATHHPSRAHFRPEDLAGIKRFRAYDDAVIVPMHGFDSVDHYYREVSSGPYLDRITLPSLVVHSKDDPMVPYPSVEPWLGRASPHVAFEITDHGGHIGWIGGVDEASWISSWATRTVLRFFEGRAATNPEAP